MWQNTKWQDKKLNSLGVSEFSFLHTLARSCYFWSSLLFLVLIYHILVIFFMIQITPRFCPPYPLTFLLFSSVQTKQYKIKTWKVHMHTTNKQTWSLLILSNSFWAYDLHWSVIDILSVLYHWKKNWFPSLSAAVNCK